MTNSKINSKRNNNKLNNNKAKHNNNKKKTATHYLSHTENNSTKYWHNFSPILQSKTNTHNIF